jgi:tRNA-guanine family transglycosylase
LQVLGRFNRARAARLTLPHFTCQTPLFMPVGTQGIVFLDLVPFLCRMLVQSQMELFLIYYKKYDLAVFFCINEFVSKLPEVT